MKYTNIKYPTGILMLIFLAALAVLPRMIL